MTQEEQRSVKAHLLLELRETSQAVETCWEKLRTWGKALEVLGRRFNEGQAKISPTDEALFDLAGLKALLAEIAELEKKKRDLDARARALGL